MLHSGFKQNPTFFFLTSDTWKALCCFSLCPGLTESKLLVWSLADSKYQRSGMELYLDPLIFFLATSEEVTFFLYRFLAGLIHMFFFGKSFFCQVTACFEETWTFALTDSYYWLLPWFCQQALLVILRSSRPNVPTSSQTQQTGSEFPSHSRRSLLGWREVDMPQHTTNLH